MTSQYGISCIGMNMMYRDGRCGYYRFKIRDEIDVPLEEVKHITSQIMEIVRDRLPEIRQAISRVEANLRNDHSS
jgi:hypothetical protein